MTSKHTEFYTIIGRRLGLLKRGNLGYMKGVQSIRLTSAAVDCSISVSAEVSDVRTITIQLMDANGDNLDYIEDAELIMYKDITPTDFITTGGSTGIASSTSGKVIATVAKKVFKFITDATGKLVVTWTDTGTESFVVGVRLPTGRVVRSAAFANV